MVFGYACAENLTRVHSRSAALCGFAACNIGISLASGTGIEEDLLGEKQFPFALTAASCCRIFLLFSEHRGAAMLVWRRTFSRIVWKMSFLNEKSFSMLQMTSTYALRRQRMCFVRSELKELHDSKTQRPSTGAESGTGAERRSSGFLFGPCRVPRAKETKEKFRLPLHTKFLKCRNFLDHHESSPNNVRAWNKPTKFVSSYAER